jgi:hypothetical protein
MRRLAVLAFLASSAAASAAPLKVVPVVSTGPLKYQCTFTPTCTMVVTDTTAPIPLVNAAGTAILQTRTFKSTADSPAAGKTMYAYRINLTQAYGITATPCISKLTLPFSSPATLDYNHDGVADEQVFVTTQSLGTIPATSASYSLGVVTLNFATPVCAGSAPGNGDSSFFVGMSHAFSPTTKTASLKDIYGPTYSVPARAPKTIQIWVPPYPDVPPSLVPNYVPAECGVVDPLTNPTLLSCWLDHFPVIAAAITWQSPGSSTFTQWPAWSARQRAELRQAFEDAWQWKQNGFAGFPGRRFQEPPTNHEVLTDGEWVQTVLAPDEAWDRYLAHVAHSLAAEIGSWVPWSIQGYTSDELQRLLSATQMYRYDSDIPNDTNNVDYPGYVVPSYLAVTPAHPVVTYSFLRDNDLLGATRKQTILKVLDWSRFHLQHHMGGFTPTNVEYHWHYRGKPPISRIIAGTKTQDPYYEPMFPDPEHWTAGCYGTTDFLRMVLAAANIPVFKKSSGSETCGHTVPHFPTEGWYLSHGDDPYTSLIKDAAIPIGGLPIDAAQWAEWFQVDPLVSCDNVGRRPAELLVQYLSEALVKKYCADTAAGLDHASGAVYGQLDSYFTVVELEATDLWGRLAQRALETGQCGGGSRGDSR